MSQPRSSSEPGTENPILESRIRTLLGGYLTEDTQPGFRQRMLLKLQDPFTRNEKGGFRLNAFLIGLGALAGLALSVFLYFNFLRP
jgi:hypothetical protein